MGPLEVQIYNIVDYQKINLVINWSLYRRSKYPPWINYFSARDYIPKNCCYEKILSLVIDHFLY